MSEADGIHQPVVAGLERATDVRSCGRRCRAAVCWLAAASVLLALGAIRVQAALEGPPPVLPPAGEVLQGEAPFRFAMIGDSRGNTCVFEAILERIAADDVSFVLHGGDIVQSYSRAQFQWVLHELAEEELGVPMCFVPGNHDIDDGADEARRYRFYTASFGPRRYWFSYADSLFVAFDNATERCTEEDLAWLDRTLGRLRDDYKSCFVFMHLPPRDPRPGHNHALQPDTGADELIQLLAEHDVTAVLASHIHSYAEDEVAGIPVFITGGGGAELEEPDDRHHYLLCTVGDDGALSVEKVDVSDQPNTDYPEYVLRVKTPPLLLLIAGGVCAVLGVALASSHRTGF